MKPVAHRHPFPIHPIVENREQMFFGRNPFDFLSRQDLLRFQVMAEIAECAEGNHANYEST